VVLDFLKDPLEMLYRHHVTQIPPYKIFIGRSYTTRSASATKRRLKSSPVGPAAHVLFLLFYGESRQVIDHVFRSEFVWSGQMSTFFCQILNNFKFKQFSSLNRFKFEQILILNRFLNLNRFWFWTDFEFEQILNGTDFEWNWFGIWRVFVFEQIFEFQILKLCWF
jgi:hypothetical protein